ncbi:MAG: glycosyltransferase [Chloroflexi bacterium AL-W]|nr:glycosyltransferase [Chloroflexi bacterium AL-N1]NOK68944.1 glycosyltransferase [Chloroflexi bacterium AL-N10]NOK76927.1 glycosyltransferase [Chloroflexi bacterium AL-N5]NOK82685.1 glycosyltransferase [Chloroflexi bacterium AL-W]NOK90784.1 glycosyltransferase [Chloroflexi bacterium AL-N15]
MRSHHLLCIYPWLNLGGADKFNLDMITCLRTLGWHITIVTTLPVEHEWHASFEPLSEALIDLAQYPPEEQPARLLHVAQSQPFDCVLISHSSTAYHLLPYLRANLPHLPFVDYNHIELPNWRQGGYPRLSLDYAHALDMQIVSSNHLKCWMEQHSDKTDHIEVCTTNIDPHEYNPKCFDRRTLRHTLDITNNATVVLYAARLDRQKQPWLTMDVMHEVSKRSYNVYFVVAGDGLFASYMHNFVRWHGLEKRILMLGAVSNQRIRELLALSDIFFLPSEMEGIALSIYEAMAMEVVPVSADVGGQSELVTPECGVLVARQTNERKTYIETLIQLIQNPIQRQKMGQQARQRIINHFQLKDMGQRMHELLLQAQTLHHQKTHKTYTTNDVRAAVRQAITVAKNDAAELTGHQLTSVSRQQQLRILYWQMVNKGAWWLVPLGENLRKRRQQST